MRISEKISPKVSPQSHLEISPEIPSVIPSQTVPQTPAGATYHSGIPLQIIFHRDCTDALIAPKAPPKRHSEFSIKFSQLFLRK